MINVENLIKDINQFADKKIKETRAEVKGIGDRISGYFNAGNYTLRNKHVALWILVTIILCLAY